MYEVVVIENNQNPASTLTSPHAIWTEVFETLEEANEYKLECIKQDKDYNKGCGEVYCHVSILVVEEAPGFNTRMQIQEIRL